MSKENQKTHYEEYWRASLKCVGGLLSLWFIVSFGCGILWSTVWMGRLDQKLKNKEEGQ